MFDTLRENSRIIVYFVVVAFVITGGFMGYGAYLSNNNAGSGSTGNPGVIAEVNDTEITQQEFMGMLQRQAPQQNLSNAQIISFRYNVLNSLIERELIMQKAEELDISPVVDDKEVEEVYNEIVTQNVETEEELTEEELNKEFEKKLEEQNYSVAQLKDDIRFNLQTNKKIQQTIDQSYSNVSVSEDEIKEIYSERYPETDTDVETDTDTGSKEKVVDSSDAVESEASEEDERPEYEDVKDDLEEELLNQKQDAAFDSWLEDMKAEADIIIHDRVLNAYQDLNNGNYDAAVEKFSSLVEENPDPVFYQYLATSYNEAGSTEKAEETYSTAVEEYPENFDLRMNLANFYSQQEKNEAAVEQLKKASELAGNDFMAHYQLFMQFNSMGAEEEAKKEMKIIQDLNEQMEQDNEAVENESDVQDDQIKKENMLEDKTQNDPAVSLENNESESDNN
ncbi:MAG: SurA N-terminal domain-containing protein [Bacillota bacterium]